MAKYRVEITAAAASDILSAKAYIARDKPRAARDWQLALKERILGLDTFPLGHEVIPEAGRIGIPYRHLIIGNYRAIYTIEEDRVIVVRVVHAARELLRSMLEGFE